MSMAKRQRLPIEDVGTATILVLNPDAHVRQLVETAVCSYPLHRNVRLIFETDLTDPILASKPDVIVVNLPARVESCLSLLSVCRQLMPQTRLIFFGPSDDTGLCDEAIQRGAYEFLPRSSEWQQLGWILQGALWTNGRQC